MRLALSLAAACLAAGAAWAQTETGSRRSDDKALLTAMESAYQKAAERAAASVVSLRVDREESRAPKPNPGRPPNPLQGMMGGAGVFGKPPEAAMFVCSTCVAEREAEGDCAKCGTSMKKVFRSVTSATVAEADGLILTSNFNVGGKVSRMVVRLADGAEHEAKLLGYNGAYDVALLKIEAKGLQPLKTADIGKVKTGMNVIALGRGPDRRSLTLNPGIISAPARLSGRAFQTDARLNYGNVGGPLVDFEGRLVGITCKVDVKYAATYGQNSGVSFAIAQDQLSTMLVDLKKGVKTQNTGQAFMGISADLNATDVEGVRLADVVKGGGAEKAGLKPGDVVIEFDGDPVKTFDELRAKILAKQINDPFRVKVKREGQEFEFTGTLGEKPADE
jgi:serine protease Do